MVSPVMRAAGHAAAGKSGRRVGPAGAVLAVAMACAVVVLALLATQQHRLLVEREEWLEGQHDLELAQRVQSLDQLYLERTLFRLWMALPEILRPADFDALAEAAERARSEGGHAAMDWTLAVRLAGAHWFQPHLRTDPEQWVADHLFEATTALGFVSRRTLARHLELRNVLAKLCLRGQLWPEENAKRCAATLERPLLGSWARAFEVHPLAENWRPYLASADEARLGALTRSMARYCSLVPYQSRLALISRSQPGKSYTAGWRVLAPGACMSEVRESIDTQPEFTFVAESVDADTVSFVSRHANSRQASFVAWRGTDGRACVADGEVRWDDHKPGCPAGTVPASSVRMHADVFLTHPGTGLALESDSSARPSDEAALRQRVEHIAEGVKRQMMFERTWSGRELPYALGPNLHDRNGVFAEGVTLVDVPAESLYGDANTLADGDELLALNGYRIFSPMDLSLAVIDLAPGIRTP